MLGNRVHGNSTVSGSSRIKGSWAHVKNGPMYAEDGGIVGDDDLSVGGTVEI
jgi:hypothetical protein